jgi:hypothetical protein
MSDEDNDQNAAPATDEPVPSAAPGQKVLVREKPYPRWISDLTNKNWIVAKIAGALKTEQFSEDYGRLGVAAK